MISKKDVTITAIYTTFTLIAGNFAYQALYTQNWAQASERSFFQFWAMLTFIMILNMGLSPSDFKNQWKGLSSIRSSSSSSQQ